MFRYKYQKLTPGTHPHGLLFAYFIGYFQFRDV